jgi:HPt (histidine-containing phosphotransfer) domain-containing protein
MVLPNVLAFNETIYENLVDADDPAFALDISRQWIEQARACVPELKELLTSQNWPQLSEKGHFLKGSAAFVGADRVKEICEELQNKEKYLRPGQRLSEYCGVRIAALPAEIDQYEAELDRLHGRAST